MPGSDILDRLYRSLKDDPLNEKLIHDYRTELLRHGKSPHIAVLYGPMGNIQALKAVLKNIQQIGITQIVCLGDLIGHGPDPDMTVDLILKHCNVTLKGEYDSALFEGTRWFSSRHRAEIIEWSRNILQPTIFSSKKKRDRWSTLQALNNSHRDNHFFISSNSLTTHVLCNSKDHMLSQSKQSFSKMMALFPKFTFTSARDVPFLIDNFQELTPITIDQFSKLELDRKYIIGTGSVGLPTGHKIRASYVELLGAMIMFHNVSYDTKEVINSIHTKMKISEKAKSFITKKFIQELQ
jgi:hypothetical protein